LRRDAPAIAGRLLRVLLLRLGAVPAGAARGAPARLCCAHVEESETSSCGGKQVTETFDDRIDVVARGPAAKTEADSAHAHLGRDIHGGQDRRQLDTTGVTRRPRRSRHAIQSRQYLAADPTDE
jgi:hypothetical protein